MFPYIYFTIPTYSLFAFMGLFSAVINSYIRGIGNLTDNISHLLKMVIIELISVFIGARTLFILTQIPQIIAGTSDLSLLEAIVGGGLVFYGGLFGAIIGLYISCYCFKFSRDDLLRVVTPSFPLFHVFGRIGCFSTGCCYGKELAFPVLCMGMEVTSIPVQLIEALCELVIFLIIIITEKKSKREFNILKIYLILYSVCRFVIEFFRGDTIRGIFFGISTAQWISIFIWTYYFIAGIRGRSKIKNAREG